MVRSPAAVIVTRPPSASTRSCGARRSGPRSPSASISNASAPSSPQTLTTTGVSGRRALERVQGAEIDGAGDLRRSGPVHVHVDPRLHAGAGRRRAELRGQSAYLEQRREDPVGELLQLPQRSPHFALHLVEERLRRRGIGFHGPRGDLEDGGEPDQILLHAAVQCPLDVATFGIADKRESSPRGSELLDLAAQPIEGWLLVGLIDLQRMPPAPGSSGSCPPSLGRRQAASTVSRRMAASRAFARPPP